MCCRIIKTKMTSLPLVVSSPHEVHRSAITCHRRLGNVRCGSMIPVGKNIKIDQRWNSGLTTLAPFWTTASSWLVILSPNFGIAHVSIHWKNRVTIVIYIKYEFYAKLSLWKEYFHVCLSSKCIFLRMINQFVWILYLLKCWSEVRQTNYFDRKNAYFLRQVQSVESVLQTVC